MRSYYRSCIITKQPPPLQLLSNTPPTAPRLSYMFRRRCYCLCINPNVFFRLSTLTSTIGADSTESTAVQKCCSRRTANVQISHLAEFRGDLNNYRLHRLICTPHLYSSTVPRHCTIGPTVTHHPLGKSRCRTLLHNGCDREGRIDETKLYDLADVELVAGS